MLQKLFVPKLSKLVVKGVAQHAPKVVQGRCTVEPAHLDTDA